MNRHGKTVEQWAELLRVLADPSRLRILGLLAGQDRTGMQCAAELGLSAATISHHMDKLERAGLVSVTREGQRRRYALDVRALDALAKLAADTAAAETREAAAPNAPARTRVLGAFFEGPRLKRIPAQRKKRVIVLQHLMERFRADRDYTEGDVNELLRAAHDDVATLRRELVDYGFLSRSAGVYRIAQDLPARGAVVRQEITGDEHAWLRDLIRRRTGV
ncbi:MAG: metalloregulator ArsR/SmtB family transcription factor [Candidatus Eisenbacteria bacterium]|nr:metalloregulator ArsR/SmtB family transcription factor [Candidatus Eisenbacteria bacterium]